MTKHVTLFYCDAEHVNAVYAALPRDHTDQLRDFDPRPLHVGDTVSFSRKPRAAFVIVARHVSQREDGEGWNWEFKLEPTPHPRYARYARYARYE